MNRNLVTWMGALLVASLANGCGADVSPSKTATMEVPVTPGEPVTPGGPVTPIATADPRSGVVTVDDTRSYSWTRVEAGSMPETWEHRDGAQMVQLATGRVLMIGGWSPYDPWGPGYVPDQGGGDRITNEVWKSDDLGKTWSLLLPHDPNPPETGPNARFLKGHTLGVAVYNGHAVVIGSDGSVEQDLLGDVWQESNNGQTWRRVARNAPTLGRALYMCANYQGAIYIMGGQESEQDPSTAKNDVWRSADGGVTWTQLGNAPWSPRGMVYRPAEHNGKLFVVGGGNYADIPATPTGFNGVYAFDGSTWTTVLPEGHKQFAPAFFQPLISLDGRLWLFNGYDVKNGEDLSRAMFSEDDGATWKSFAGGAGGGASHADSLVVASGRILRVSGSMDEKTVWAFEHTP